MATLNLARTRPSFPARNFRWEPIALRWPVALMIFDAPNLAAPYKSSLDLPTSSTVGRQGDSLDCNMPSKKKKKVDQAWHGVAFLIGHKTSTGTQIGSACEIEQDHKSIWGHEKSVRIQSWTILHWKILKANLSSFMAKTCENHSLLD